MNARVPGSRHSAAAGSTGAAAALILAACAPAALPAPPIVVVVPTALPPEPEPIAAEPPTLVCPPGMVFVAGGLGRVGERQRHIDDVCLDVTEVTADAYARCVERGACNDVGLLCDDAWTYQKIDQGQLPVNCVSWQQADRYCRVDGKRLPTFEEWEWAAQGRIEERRFSWGNAAPEDDQMCWSRSIARNAPCPVGSFPAARTPQGIDDLFGNVWEWLAPSERNGVPNVARGGSWQNNDEDVLEGENAGAFVAGFVRNDVVGFRCAYDAGRGR